MWELDRDANDSCRGEVLAEILRVSNKHPNSRVSKLIRSVEEERTQKNIVLLLIELAENAEYATEFGISLKYYLDMFEQLGIGRSVMLNEAALLLLNSSKVYARRVDFVHELVERQILTLSNADHEINEAKKKEQEVANAVEKPKRTRKRLLEATNDPYDVELVPRKFRKLTEDKRFAIIRPNSKAEKFAARNIDTEQYIHPAAWKHATIVDLENDEEIDSKRNYKLFTYQVEHRYNTLVPDINFRLHFKVKDYIDEEEERLEEDCRENGDCSSNSNNINNSRTRQWPPLSEEYVSKYLDLEDKVLEEEMMPQRKRFRIEPAEDNCHGKSKGKDSAALETVQICNLVEMSAAACSTSKNFENDTGLGESLLTNSITDVSTNIETADVNSTASVKDASNTSETTALEQVQNLDDVKNSFLDSSTETANDSGNDSTELSTSDKDKSQDDSIECSEESAITNCSMEKSVSEAPPQNDSALGESINEESSSQNTSCKSNLNETNIGIIETSGLENTEYKNAEAENTPIESNGNDIKDVTENDQINLNEIRVHLPHLDDEGVYFSDLDELEHRMLSPTVVATDVLPCIPNKKNITIIVDDEIKALLNIPDEEPETYQLPVENEPSSPPIVINILKIHEKFLRRRVLFKLGPDMDLFLQARCMKRTRGVEAERRAQRVLKWFPLSDTDMTGVNITPMPSPGQDSQLDFCGFTDDEDDYDDSDVDDATGDFHGFSEEEQSNNSVEKNSHRLSRDSGVSVDAPLTPPVKSSLDTIIETLNDGVEHNVEAMSAKTTDATLEKVKDDKTSTQTTAAAAEELKPNENKDKQNASAEIVTECDENITTNTENTSQEIDIAMDCEDTENRKDSPPEGEESVSKKLDDHLADIELNNSKTKIQKWHEYLQPILAKSRERHHFDVFQIGTEIINELQKPGEKNNLPSTSAASRSITFQDVMCHKDESYVSRYFLSSLLLANQNNIKITVDNKSSEAPSAWSDIHFELLSTKRHTVAIEDNIGMINVKPHAAPTQTTHGTRIKSMKNSTANYKAKAQSKHALDLCAIESDLLNVNLNVVRPLKKMEKIPNDSDDYDSGIFSNEEHSL